jgi:hypothetical protein
VVRHLRQLPAVDGLPACDGGPSAPQQSDGAVVWGAALVHARRAGREVGVGLALQGAGPREALREPARGVQALSPAQGGAS